METGVNGTSGALAQKHANMGNNIENENANRQLHNMAERNALDNLLKPNLATKKCRVQVSFLDKECSLLFEIILVLFRRGSRINTERCPKRASKAQVSEGIRSMLPLGKLFDSPKSPFLGF